MSDRVSRYILLCEDQTQERLVKAFMKARGLKADAPYVDSIVASRLCHGGNVDWVLKRFPKELHACRKRQIAKAETRLIVMVDADEFTVDERRREVLCRVSNHDDRHFAESSSVALLVPKRNVETWVCALLGDQVNEEDDYKTNKPFTAAQIRTAGKVLADWSRPGAACSPANVPSLLASFPEWLKIG